MSDRPHTPPPLHLAEHPFFRGMNPEFLDLLKDKVHERPYHTGDLVVREGETADEFSLIYSGKVALEIGVADRPRTTIQTLGPGEVVGWSWLAPPYRWRFDARALKPTRTLALTAPRLRALLESRPADGYQFLMRLLPVVAERLENTRLQLLDLYGV
jgi:CRP-like cAMP-binding protein